MHAVAKRTPHKHENIIKLIKNTKKQNSAPHCCSMSVVCRLPSAAPPNIHPPRIHTKYQYCALRTCVRYYVCCLSTRQHASSRSLNGWNAFAVNGSRVRRCMRACCCLLLLPFAVCLFLSFFIFLAHSYLMVTWLSIAFALVFNFSACVVLSIFFLLFSHPERVSCEFTINWVGTIYICNVQRRCRRGKYKGSYDAGAEVA